MTWRTGVLALACGLGVMVIGSAHPFAGRGNCGPALCIALDRSWYGSVGWGVVKGDPGAWVLAGNFWFPADAAGHEATPSVPSGKLLIQFSDFPVLSTYARWRRVTRLRLPANRPATKQLVAWHVRFAGRAVFIHVRFGSQPTARVWRLANARLATVRRKR